MGVDIVSVSYIGIQLLSVSCTLHATIFDTTPHVSIQHSTTEINVLDSFTKNVKGGISKKLIDSCTVPTLRITRNIENV